MAQLFWSDSFEPLGNEAEDYMIVPSLQIREPKDIQIVGLSGRTASGKSTFGAALQSMGFLHLKYSDAVRSAYSVSLSREQLRDAGAELHEIRGQRWLGERLIESIGNSPRVVVDGLRYPEDVAFWVERFGPRFTHLHLDVDDGVRRQRFLNRVGVNDFEAADRAATEEHHARMSALASIIVDNNSDQSRLQASAEGLLERLGIR